MALTQISTQGIKDGTITGTDLATNVDLVDNQKLRLGTSQNLEIYNNSNTAFLAHTTGGIKLSVAGGSNQVQINKGVVDEHMAKFIADGAVELYYDNSKKAETDSFGFEVFGELRVTDSGYGNTHFNYLGGGNNYINQGDSSQTFFRNASATVRTQIETDGDWTWKDNIKIQLGNSQDLQIFHDPQYGHSFIKEGGPGGLIFGSDLYEFYNAAISEKMLTATENGAVELYHNNSKKFETTSSGVTVTGTINFGSGMGSGLNSNGFNINFADSNGAQDMVKFGNSGDLQIYHNGSHSVIKNGTGTLFTLADNLSFKNNANNETLITAAANGAVELYYDDSKKFETTSTGATITGTLAATNTSITTQMFMPDNGQIRLGDSDDLQIYHDGSTNIIDGRFHPIELRHQSEVHIKCVDDGAVELYYDNSKQFETTADGIDVQGHITLAASNNAPKITFDENGANDPKAEIQMDQVNGTNGHLIFKTEGGGTLSERMRILSDGAVCINATSRPVVGTEFLGVQGGSASNSVGIAAAVTHNEGIPFFASNSSNSFADRLMRFAAGSGGDVRGTIIFNGSAMVYGGTSDYRLKENITSISDGITKLKSLNPINFNWIKDETNTSIMGFIAHEVQAVMPEAVAGKKDAVDSKGKEDYQEMDYGRITPLIVAALQEAIGRIEVLETEVAALKAA